MKKIIWLLPLLLMLGCITFSHATTVINTPGTSLMVQSTKPFTVNGFVGITGPVGVNGTVSVNNLPNFTTVNPGVVTGSLTLLNSSTMTYADVSGTIADEGLTMRQVFRGYANMTTAGYNPIVFGQSGLRVRVLSYSLSCNTLGGLVNYNFVSASTSSVSAISATFTLEAGGANTVTEPHDIHGYFQTNLGETLGLNLGQAAPCGINVRWLYTDR